MLASVLLHEVPSSGEIDNLAYGCAWSYWDWGGVYAAEAVALDTSYWYLFTVLCMKWCDDTVI
jgi:hypothetical protein